MWKLNEMHILTACFITTLAIDLYEHGSLACCQDRYLVDIAMLCAKLLFKKKKSVIQLDGTISHPAKVSWVMLHKMFLHFHIRQSDVPK